MPNESTNIRISDKFLAAESEPRSRFDLHDKEKMEANNADNLKSKHAFIVISLLTTDEAHSRLIIIDVY